MKYTALLKLDMPARDQDEATKKSQDAIDAIEALKAQGFLVTLVNVYPATRAA